MSQHVHTRGDDDIVRYVGLDGVKRDFLCSADIHSLIYILIMKMKSVHFEFFFSSQRWYFLHHFVWSVDLILNSFVSSERREVVWYRTQTLSLFCFVAHSRARHKWSSRARRWQSAQVQSVFDGLQRKHASVPVKPRDFVHADETLVIERKLRESINVVWFVDNGANEARRGLDAPAHVDGSLLRLPHAQDLHLARRAKDVGVHAQRPELALVRLGSVHDIGLSWRRNVVHEGHIRGVDVHGRRAAENRREVLLQHLRRAASPGVEGFLVLIVVLVSISAAAAGTAVLRLLHGLGVLARVCLLLPLTHHKCLTVRVHLFIHGFVEESRPRRRCRSR